MDPLKNRSKRILQLAIQNSLALENEDVDLPTTSKYLDPGDKENIFKDDDADFSPASDDDKTYSPLKKISRRSSSSSSSSSLSSSSSSSSFSNKSSVSSSTEPDSSNNQLTVQCVNASDENLELINPTFNCSFDTPIISSSDLNNQSARDEENDIQPVDGNTKKPKKRIKNQRVTDTTKALKDSGQQYVSSSKTKKVFPAKLLKQTCGSTCRLKCSERISEELRKQLFDDYWGMASLVRQREYVARNMEEIKPKYQYKKLNSNRKLKNAFYFDLNGTKTKVCKTFFKNTLNITDRCIRTVIEKKNSTTGVLQGEQRGKHGKHRKIPDDLIEGVKCHIRSIPRIESHYLRQQTTREYIDGGKTLLNLYFDYKEDCIKQGLPYVMIHIYRKIFNEKFNISFFVPKKDQCEQCTRYKLAEGSEKVAQKEDYENHLAEKEKSREEKANDKEMVSPSFIVACYDLQAVMTVPNGEISTFYYKSKINCLNFTISELRQDSTECFFWDESQGNRGANEIGTCVLKYLQKKSSSVDEYLDVVFYSDNCCGQQKNQFIIGVYIYAVLNLKIKSITHKFLIRGHTQNEGDAVHSLIEKQVKRCLRSGPIYVPSQYISAIRSAKKRGTPFVVNEMGYSDFIDIKQLPVPRLNKGVDGQVVKLSDIKVIKIEKSEDNEIKIQYKKSFFDDYKDLDLTKRTSRSNRPTTLKPLYQRKLDISEKKKHDVMSLIDAGLIPRYYTSYYDSIFQ